MSSDNKDDNHIIIDGQTYIYTAALRWQNQIIKQNQDRLKLDTQQRIKKTRERNRNTRNDDNDPFDFR